MKDWDKPAALEALARAHWVAGDLDEARRYAEEGRALTARIEDDDDRAIIEADFATIACIGVPAPSANSGTRVSPSDGRQVESTLTGGSGPRC